MLLSSAVTSAFSSFCSLLSTLFRTEESSAGQARLSLFFFQAEDGIRDLYVTGVQTCALPICAVVTRKLKPVPVEAIARGYLIGSGWKDYQRTGKVSGIELPDGLRQAEKLAEPIFTPSTKAAVGDHDENIDFDAMVKTVGAELAERVRDATLRIYRYAADVAAERGILLADTKFEFGTDEDGRLYIMDEMLTPDSSRYWPADQYE